MCPNADRPLGQIPVQTLWSSAAKDVTQIALPPAVLGRRLRKGSASASVLLADFLAIVSRIVGQVDAAASEGSDFDNSSWTRRAGT